MGLKERVAPEHYDFSDITDEQKREITKRFEGEIVIVLDFHTEYLYRLGRIENTEGDFFILTPLTGRTPTDRILYHDLEQIAGPVLIPYPVQEHLAHFKRDNP